MEPYRCRGRGRGRGRPRRGPRGRHPGRERDDAAVARVADGAVRAATRGSVRVAGGRLRGGRRQLHRQQEGPDPPRRVQAPHRHRLPDQRDDGVLPGARPPPRGRRRDPGLAARRPRSAVRRRQLLHHPEHQEQGQPRPRLQADPPPVRGGRAGLVGLHRRRGGVDAHGAVEVRQRGLQGVQVPGDDGAARLVLRRGADRAEPLGGGEPPPGLAPQQAFASRPRQGRPPVQLPALRALRLGPGRLRQRPPVVPVQRAGGPVLRAVLSVRDVRRGSEGGARLQHSQLRHAVRRAPPGDRRVLPVHLLHSVQGPAGDREREQDDRDARPEPAAEAEARHGQVPVDRGGDRLRLPGLLAALLHHHAGVLSRARAGRVVQLQVDGMDLFLRDDQQCIQPRHLRLIPALEAKTAEAVVFFPTKGRIHPADAVHGQFPPAGCCRHDPRRQSSQRGPGLRGLGVLAGAPADDAGSHLSLSCVRVHPADTGGCVLHSRGHRRPHDAGGLTGGAGPGGDADAPGGRGYPEDGVDDPHRQDGGHQVGALEGVQLEEQIPAQVQGPPRAHSAPGAHLRRLGARAGLAGRAGPRWTL